MFRQYFENKHVVLPVIHCIALEQTLRNAQIAQDCGADGVFVINHGISAEALWDLADKTTALLPKLWVGINVLGGNSYAVFDDVTNKVKGVWVDNAAIDEKNEHQQHAEALWTYRQEDKSDWNGLYFGGVAFKYQRQVDNVGLAARIASKYMDVVTTSGPGTGQAASIEKIRLMKEALGEFPLAIASGITPDNVLDYLPYSDCFLVATGISSSFDELDSQKTRKLIKIIRDYKLA